MPVGRGRAASLVFVRADWREDGGGAPVPEDDSGGLWAKRG